MMNKKTLGRKEWVEQLKNALFEKSDGRLAWDAMSLDEKDSLVWSMFPDIPARVEEWVISRDGGESGELFYDTKADAERVQADGSEIFLWQYPQPFTTSRDACALVLGEIDKMEGADKLWMGLQECLLPGSQDSTRERYLELLLKITPDDICYCAVMAVRGGGCCWVKKITNPYIMGLFRVRGRLKGK